MHIFGKTSETRRLNERRDFRIESKQYCFKSVSFFYEKIKLVSLSYMYHLQE